ncbi:MAG: T9SS type A sorting domain-containing protein [Bacteroidetes bacterium]|nr:T9SS type A sorting domain-containing protein [Bacteroidota bacterium]
MIKTIYILLFIVLPLNAQWRKGGVEIVDTTANRNMFLSSQIVEDGNGGGIICWQDGRSGSGYDIYAQRIDSNGVIQWQRNGIPICQASLNQSYPRMISDGEDGAIIAWEDDRDTVRTIIYAQKVSHNGEIKWPVNGVRISNEGGLFVRPVSDGNGGVIIAWQSVDFVTNHERVICQRINKYGQKMWGENGVLVNSRLGFIRSNDVGITSDHKGGAIITWGQENIIYSQRASANGTILWDTNGIVICNAPGGRGAVCISSSNNSSAIISWSDPFRDSLKGIYAQRIDSSGNSIWTLNGIFIGSPGETGGGGGSRRIISDNLGGAFIGYGLKIQRVSFNGELQFDTAKGRYSYFPSTNSAMALDLKNGVINACESLLPHGDKDVFVNRIDSLGNPLWGNNGIKLVENPIIQEWAKIISDTKGGAIVVWQDWRAYGDSATTPHVALFAQRVYSNGVVADVVKEEDTRLLKKINLYQNYPNPFNPETTISYYIPYYGKAKLLIYDILGQKINTLIDEYQAEGEHKVIWNGINDSDVQVSSGIYFYQLHFENNLITKKFIIVR